MSRWKRAVLPLLMALLAAILLSACSLHVDIYVHKEEKWKVEEKLTTPRNLGSLGLQMEGLGIKLPLNTELPMAMAFNQMAATCPQHGWDCKVDKSTEKDEVVFLFTAQGKGYVSLQTFLNSAGTTFDQQMRENNDNIIVPLLTVREENGGVHIADASAGAQLLTAESQALVGSLFPVKVRIHGRKIIGSNADEVKGGMAIWNSARPIDVTLVPGSAVSWTYTLGLLLVGAIIVIGLVIGTVKLLPSMLSSVKVHSTPSNWDADTWEEAGETDYGESSSYYEYEDNGTDWF